MAVSDPTGTIARPLPPILRIDSRDGQAALDHLIAEHAPAKIVVGEPKQLSGAVGEQARVVHAFVERLRARVDVPVELVDERLSSVEAARRAKESGSATGVDSLAACILLESVLVRG